MKITNRRRVYDGHFKVNELTLKTDAGEELRRERFEPGRAAAALLFDTATQHYVLTRQFRIGPEADLLEIAAGMIDNDETPDAAIRREIQEELGYEVDALTPIADIWPSPGTSGEKISVFYAEVSRQTSAGGGLAAEHEQIEAVRLTRAQLFAEPLHDAKTLLAVQWVRLHN